MGRSTKLSGSKRTRIDYADVVRRSGAIPTARKVFGSENISGDLGPWYPKGAFSDVQKQVIQGSLRSRVTDFIDRLTPDLNDASAYGTPEQVHRLDDLWIQTENFLEEIRDRRQLYRGSDLSDLLSESSNRLRAFQLKVEQLRDYYYGEDT